MKKTRRIKGNGVEEKAGETKEGKERDNVHNRIVTRTSTTCFHNYDLLKIHIGARSDSYYRGEARHCDEGSTRKTIAFVRSSFWSTTRRCN